MSYRDASIPPGYTGGPWLAPVLFVRAPEKDAVRKGSNQPSKRAPDANATVNDTQDAALRLACGESADTDVFGYPQKIQTRYRHPAVMPCGYPPRGNDTRLSDREDFSAGVRNTHTFPAGNRGRRQAGAYDIAMHTAGRNAAA